MKRILFKLFCLATLAMVAETLHGQLLTAVDKSHLNTNVTEIKIIEVQKQEMAKKYVSYIYNSWENSGVRNAYGNFTESTYKVDLRSFTMPTTNTKITSNYGIRWNRMHEGIDIKVYIGDTIFSAFEGKVRVVGYNRKGYGKFIVIRHPNGLETIYAHLSKYLVKENQIIGSGTPIGIGGNTGRSTGSHLHFECRILGKTINPAKLFDFESQDILSDYYIFEKNKVNNGRNYTRINWSSTALNNRLLSK